MLFSSFLDNPSIVFVVCCYLPSYMLLNNGDLFLELTLEIILHTTVPLCPSLLSLHFRLFVSCALCLSHSCLVILLPVFCLSNFMESDVSKIKLSEPLQISFIASRYMSRNLVRKQLPSASSSLLKVIFLAS